MICHKQYSITNEDYQFKRAVNTKNLQATMDDLTEAQPQRSVQSCHVCDEEQKSESNVSKK